MVTQIRDNVEKLNLLIAEFRTEVTEFRTDIELLRADMDRRFDHLESLVRPGSKTTKPRSGNRYPYPKQGQI